MSELSLRQNFFGSLWANGYGFFVALAAQLLAVPFFLHFWEAPLYGAWLVLLFVPSLASLSDLGLGVVGLNQLTMLAGRRDDPGLRAVLHTIVGAALIGFVLGSVAFAALSFALPWSAWLHLAIPAGDVGWTMFWLALCGLTDFFIGPLFGSYRIVHRNGRGVALTNTVRLATLVATLVAAACSHRLPVVAFVQAAAQLVGTLLVLWDAVRFLPRGLFGVRDFSPAILRPLLRPAAAYTLFPIGSAIYLQGLSLVVNATAGVGGVVAFNVARALTRLIVQVAMIFRQSAAPEFSLLLGRGEFDRLRRFHARILAATLAAMGGLAFGLIVFYPVILAWWTHGKVAVAMAVFLPLCLAAVANGTWQIGNALLQASNHHERLAICYCVVTLLSVPVAYALSVSLGLAGAALATALVDFLLVPYTLLASLRGIERRVGAGSSGKLLSGL